MQNFNNWEAILALAIQMAFHAFNTGRINGKVKTYFCPTSVPENIDMNMFLDYNILAFHFKHLEKEIF